MPFRAKNRDAITPDADLPHHLQHKPVFALPYQMFDGLTQGETDAKFISVGMAQYDPTAVSLKIFRHTGEGGKWSRISEELPLHRAVDAVLFLAKVLYDSDGEEVTLPAGTLEGQSEEIVIDPEDEQRTQVEKKNFQRFLDDEGEWLQTRFRKLHDVLSQLTEEGKL